MSKKKKSKPKARKVTPKSTPSEAIAPKIIEVLRKFSEREVAPKPSIVQTLVQPPENMAEHLSRIGADSLPRIMEVVLDGDYELTECLVIPWQALQDAEYRYLASGQWKGNGIGQA